MAAVTFDVFHTLIYLLPREEEAYYRQQVALATEALSEGEEVPGAPELSESALTALFEKVLSDALAESGRGRTVTPAEQIRQAGTAAGRVPDVPHYLERLSQAVLALPIKAAPGAAAVLERLEAEGYRIGIIGNTVGETGATIRTVLHRLGLDRQASTVIFSDEQPWAKPAPEIFWAALEGLGTPARQAVHVGDRWFDIEGAHRAGMGGAILYTGLQDYGPHYRSLHERKHAEDPPADRVVQDLAELPAAVHALVPVSSAHP